MAKKVFDDEIQEGTPEIVEKKVKTAGSVKYGLGDDDDEDPEDKAGAVPEAPVVKAGVVSKPKLVKIQMVESVKSSVAGTTYTLSKGSLQEVPSDVAAILVNSKKAYRV